MTDAELVADLKDQRSGLRDNLDAEKRMVAYLRSELARVTAERDALRAWCVRAANWMNGQSMQMGPDADLLRDGEMLLGIPVTPRPWEVTNDRR